MEADEMGKFLLTWRQWDYWSAGVHGRLKGGERQTARMEDACHTHAKALGMTTTAFREALMAARRAGLSYEDAIAEVCG